MPELATLGRETSIASGASAMADETTSTLTDGQRVERLAALQSLIEMMRPAVQADGGDLVLLSADLESGVIEVQLQGACSTCAISSSTLQGGVERILKGRLDWVTDVIGGVDEVNAEQAVPVGIGGWVPRADL